MTTITKDTAVSIGLVMTLMAAAWYASDQNARLRVVESQTAPISQIQQDVAIIKQTLRPARMTLGASDK